jgi:predicted enzyme related to lactoylglutathione lyase
VFGVSLTQLAMEGTAMEMFPFEQDGPGASGALVAAEGYSPSHAGTMVYFSVPDIGATLSAVERGGGSTLLPKMSIGEFGFVAHFQDTEGNRVGLHAMT